MPELPEVETIRSGLERRLKGGRFLDFITFWPKSVKIDKNELKKKLNNAKIIAVIRKAKYLLVMLDNRSLLILHLRMTGHLLIRTAPHAQGYWNEKGLNEFFSDDPYIRHAWKLSAREGKIILLAFSDIRKFGTIDLVPSVDLEKWEKERKLGIEPLSREFTLAKLKGIVSCRNTPVKLLILDQGKISGIGNIYASEILFDAGIMPDRKAGELHEKEIKALFASIKKILKLAVEQRGTTIGDYRDADGQKGSFQNYLKVYGRKGGKCLRKNCSGIVKRTVLGQRGTFYCDNCQR
jgi:formamidopyrimidine-DNA glycosylase